MDAYTKDFITLLDEEGTEHKFEILDTISNKEGVFYALLPKNNFKSEDCTNGIYGYYIFEELENGDEQILTEVENPEKLKRLSKIFEEHFESLDYY